MYSNRNDSVTILKSPYFGWGFSGRQSRTTRTPFNQTKLKKWISYFRPDIIFPLFRLVRQNVYPFQTVYPVSDHTPKGGTLIPVWSFNGSTPPRKNAYSLSMKIFSPCTRFLKQFSCLMRLTSSLSSFTLQE